MSFKSYAVPLPLELRPSARLRAGIAAFHGVLVAAVLLSGHSRPLVAAGLGLVLISVMSALFWVRRPVGLVWAADDSVSGHIWRNRIEQARVLPSTYLSEWLVILHLIEPDTGTRWRVPIATDSLSDDSFRRLRVRLRTSGVLNPTESADPP